MTTCPACNSPIEPIAQIRTYHSGCDPQGRVEMLEKTVDRIRQLSNESQEDLRNGFPVSARKILSEISEAARVALEYRPAQMKERE